jgi:hypothetical protein
MTVSRDISIGTPSPLRSNNARRISSGIKGGRGGRLACRMGRLLGALGSEERVDDWSHESEVTLSAWVLSSGSFSTLSRCLR